MATEFSLFHRKALHYPHYFLYNVIICNVYVSHSHIMHCDYYSTEMHIHDSSLPIVFTDAGNLMDLSQVSEPHHLCYAETWLCKHR